MNLQHIYDLEANLDAFAVLDPLDIQQFNEQLLKKKRSRNISAKEQKALIFYLNKTENNIKTHPEEQQRESRARMRAFVNFYEFLI